MAFQRFNHFGKTMAAPRVQLPNTPMIVPISALHPFGCGYGLIVPSISYNGINNEEYYDYLQDE